MCLKIIEFLNYALADGFMHQVAIETIESKNLEKKGDILLVDVRSPKEFDESHIPGAINVALLDNLERHEIGILYKQEGRDIAIQKGLEVANPKFPGMIADIKTAAQGRMVVVYCARGGMRSRVVTELLVENGVKAVQLVNGFKGYMQFAHESLAEIGEQMLQKRMYVLAGKTGTGKTDLLHLLAEKGYPVLDLEGLAQHRASVFGGVNLKPRSQKQFMLELRLRLKELLGCPYIITEYESRRIGNCFMPEFMAQCLAKAALILVESDLACRTERIFKDYFSHPGAVGELRRIVALLVNYLGKKRVAELQGFLDSGKHREFVEEMLVGYYDEKYNLPKREAVFTVNSDDVDKACEEICNFVA